MGIKREVLVVLLLTIVFLLINILSVSACNQSINADTTLSQNYTVSGTAFCINSSNVVLDCAGYNITGDGTGSGINVSYKVNTTIDNCNIYSFINGISVEYSNSTIVNNVTSRNNTKGIFLSYADNSFVNNSIFRNNTNHGISAAYSDNNTIFNVTALANKNIGMYFTGCHFLNITKNLVINSSTNDGIQILGGSNNTFVVDNQLIGNLDDAIVTSAMINSTIKNNIINGGHVVALDANYGRGLNIKDGSKNNTIANNSISHCGTYAINNENRANRNLAENNTITNCTIGIVQSIVNDTIIRKNNIKSCTHGIQFGVFAGVRNVKITENTITDAQSRSTGASSDRYLVFPAGLYAEHYGNYNGGSSNNQIFNNTFANNSIGMISFIFNDEMNISGNRFINNTNGAFAFMNSQDMTIRDNTYTNNGEDIVLRDFEPGVKKGIFDAASGNLTITKYIYNGTTLLALADVEQNDQNIAFIPTVDVYNSSRVKQTTNRYRQYGLSPKIGWFVAIKITKSDYYDIVAYPSGMSANATNLGAFVMSHAPGNMTLSVLPFPKSIYGFINSHNITITNETVNTNQNLSGLYLFGSYNLNFTNVSIMNTKASYIINNFNNTFENSNLDANVIIENTDFGKINFTQDINISTSRRLYDFINISQSKIHVNSSMASEFNKPAILTFKNISYLSLANPRPMVDSNDNTSFDFCPSCVEISYSDDKDTFVYSVPQFTAYSLNETPVIPPGGSHGPRGSGMVGGVVPPDSLAQMIDGIKDEVPEEISEELENSDELALESPSLENSIEVPEILIAMPVVEGERSLFPTTLVVAGGIGLLVLILGSIFLLATIKFIPSTPRPGLKPIAVVFLLVFLGSMAFFAGGMGITSSVVNNNIVYSGPANIFDWVGIFSLIVAGLALVYSYSKKVFYR